MDGSDWSAVMLTLSRWTATFSALITAMILTRMLDPAMYGLYSKLWLVYFIFGQVLISTIASVSMQRISAASNAIIALRIHLRLSFYLAIAIGLLLFFGASALAKALNAESISQPIRFFTPYIFFSVLTSSMEALYIFQKKRKNYLAFTVFFHVLNAVTVVVAFIFFESLSMVVLLMGLVPLVRYLYMLKYVLALPENVAQVDKSPIEVEWKASFSLLGVLFVGTFLSIASKDLDRWIVATSIQDQAEFALYAIGAKKVPLVAGMTSSISAALVAHYSGSIKNGQGFMFTQRIHDHVNRFIGPIILLIIFVGFHAESILSLLYGSIYADAAVYFSWYQWALLGDVLFGLTIFLIAEDKKNIFWVSISEFSTNFVLSLLFMFWIGPVGVIIATVFSHIIFSFIAIWIGCKAYKLSMKDFFPSIQRLFNVFLICLIPLLLVEFIPYWKLFDRLWEIVPMFFYASVVYGVTGLLMLKKFVSIKE